MCFKKWELLCEHSKTVFLAKQRFYARYSTHFEDTLASLFCYLVASVQQVQVVRTSNFQENVSKNQPRDVFNYFTTSE